jgi:N-acetylneuraminic acid mutarotase
VGGELFVFAGAKWNPETDGVMNVTGAYAYSVARNQWRELRPCPAAVRGVTAVPLSESTIYLAGGYGPDGFTDKAVIYDIVRDSYEEAQPLPYAAQVGLVKAGEFIYCVGGEDRMKHRSDAFHRIRISEVARPVK